MRTTLVRGAVAVIGSALAVSLGLVAPSAQAAISAPAGADPSPGASAAAYLAARPGGNGVIHVYYSYVDEHGVTQFGDYDDYGLTIDAAWALSAFGGYDAKLATITSALETNIPNYVFGGGAAAKMAAYLLSQGDDDGAVEDVVTELEGHIDTVAPNAGRLKDDTADPNDDFNTPLTQAYAVNALNNSGSDKANSALSFLLEQQCAAGFFRGSFSAKDAVDQSCDGAPTSIGNPDTTSLAVLMLQDQKSKPVVKAAIDDALDWLTSQQATDGSFNSGNANTTGLAGWALGVGGRTTAATKVAVWLRGQQLANAGGCAKYAAADNGAVTLDALGLANAATGALDQIDTSVAARATAQSLPALLWAPGGAAAGDSTLAGPTGFQRAGSSQTVSLAGAPGNTVCVTTGSGAGTRVVLDASGKATVQTTAPAATGKVTITATDAGGETDTASYTALAATDLDLKVKKSVRKNARLVVKVAGLEDGEHVTVTVGRKKLEATANAAGKAKVKLTAVKAGKLKIKAVGVFADRKARATVAVRP